MARKLEVAIVGDASRYQRALAKASGSSQTFGGKVTRMGKIAAAGLAIVGAAGIGAGAKMIGLASDAAEVESKFKIIFGRTVPRLTKRIDAFAKATGASRFELREQVADMGALLGPILKNTRATGDMSIKVAQLATDLGSFNNVPVADALEAIRSGLVGETEPLRRFGVLLNESAVNAEGLRLGLIRQGEVMTEQEKVQARYSLIMKQTKKAQGDATRTADSFANQIKRLKNTAKDTATEIGKKLLPHIQTLVEFVNKKAIPAIEGFFDELGRREGFKAKLSFVWTGLKEQARRLVEALRKALGRADWSTVARTISENLTTKVKITAEFLGKGIDAMNAWVDSHLDEIGEIGAKIMLAVISKLTDPGFWRENWKLVLGVAVAVFPVSRVLAVGFKIAGGILGVVAKLLPAGMRGIGGRAVDAILGVLGRLPGRVQGIIVRVVTGAVDALSRLVGYIRQTVRGVLERIPAYIEAAFRLSFFIGFVNAIKNGWERVKNATRTAVDFLRRQWNRVKGPIDAVVDVIRTVWNWLKKITGTVWKIKIKVPKPSLPNLDPRDWFGSGGVVPGPRGQPRMIVAHGGETILPTHRRGGAAVAGSAGTGFPGGPVMVLTTREVAAWLQGLDRDYKRANGGRPILGT